MLTMKLVLWASLRDSALWLTRMINWCVGENKGLLTPAQDRASSALLWVFMAPVCLLTCNFPGLAIHITLLFRGQTKPLGITWGNHQTVSRVSVELCWAGTAFCIWSCINILLPDFKQRNHRQVVKTVEDINVFNKSLGKQYCAVK